MRKLPRRTEGLDTKAPPRRPPDWEQRWGELFDLGPALYLAMDPKGVIEGVNLPLAAMLGALRHHMVGMPFSTYVRRRDLRALLDHLGLFREAGEAQTDLTVCSRDGGEIEARLDSRWTKAFPGMCFTTVTDLRDRKAAERDRVRLEAAERAARGANNQAKDRFIASLSHELRAPLAPALFAAARLASGALPPEDTRRLSQMIVDNIRREARLIDDLLDVSRISAEKMTLQKQLVNVHDLVRAAVDMVTVPAQAGGLSMRLGLDAAHSGVQADSNRLVQVFTNLLNNAVKFSRRGGQIDVRSWNRGSALLVEVKDDGVGLDSEAVSRIFNTFEQASSPEAGARGGLGLGLSIARGIVELHGGTITVHSPGLGRGTRFIVELATAGPAPAVAPNDGVKEQADVFGNGARVLVVEDEKDLAEVISYALESAGFRVSTAPTAAAALFVPMDEIALVISDVGLPDLDGWRLLPQLTAKHKVPAIALSGYGTEADVHASHEAGFVRHLTKPVTPSDLLAAVRAVLAAS